MPPVASLHERLAWRLMADCSNTRRTRRYGNASRVSCLRMLTAWQRRLLHAEELTTLPAHACSASAAGRCHHKLFIIMAIEYLFCALDYFFLHLIILLGPCGTPSSSLPPSPSPGGGRTDPDPGTRGGAGRGKRHPCALSALSACGRPRSRGRAVRARASAAGGLCACARWCVCGARGVCVCTRATPVHVW